MDERGHRHFKSFKGWHKRSMALAQVEQRDPTSSNGGSATWTMQENLHVADEHLPDELPRKQWWRLLLQKASTHLVRKTPDGVYQISKGTAGIFISALLGLAVAGGLGLLSQRDQITRLQTLQEVQEKANLDMASKLDQVRNFATVNDRNMARIEGKFDQFALTFSIKNVDKAKVGINPE